MLNLFSYSLHKSYPPFDGNLYVQFFFIVISHSASNTYQVKMYFQLATVGLLLLARESAAVDVTRDPSLDASLVTAATQLDRLALLSSNNDWLFDFTIQEPYYNFAPGGVTNMNAATFPAATGNGMTSKIQNDFLPVPHISHEFTVAMLNLGPCAMLPPHYHPRATNYVVAVHGNTTTYMFEENGAALVTEVLTPGKATIFPQASMHMMINNGKAYPLYRFDEMFDSNPAGVSIY